MRTERLINTRPRCKQLAAVVWLGVIASAARGQVVHDGSVGQAGALAGPSFQIPASRGRLVGTNLFHSFSSFNLRSGESATFDGPASVTNVLARVTGGTASTLNGTLRCTIPNADFYLINPAGVVFGPDARLDVSGSFAVSTADVIRLSDGGRFEATTPASSVLTSAPPAAFGFLGSSPKGVTLSEGVLVVGSGKAISVVGGDVKVSGGSLSAPGGVVNVAGLASAGEAAFDPANPAAGITLPASGRANVNLSNRSRIDVSDASSGTVRISANDLKVDASGIGAQTTAAVAGDIRVELTGKLDIEGAGLISSIATGAGRGGDVFVSAADVTINSKTSNSLTGIGTNALGSGRGGDVHLTAQSLTMKVGGQISAKTEGDGAAGNVAVDLGHGPMVLDGPTGPIPAGTLVAGVTADTSPGSTGAGGNVTVQAGQLTIRSRAVVSATTNRVGRGGNVDVQADTILVDATLNDNLNFTGIAANTQSPFAQAAGGSVTATAGTVRILNGGGISAATQGAGKGGTVTINASGVFEIRYIESQLGPLPQENFFGVSAAVQGAGDGGDLNIRAKRILLSQGRITAGAQRNEVTLSVGTGSAGNVRLLATDSIDITDRSTVTTFSTASGGKIAVVSGKTLVLENSTINGLSGGNPVVPVISAPGFFRSNSKILTNAALPFPGTDIAGSLVDLRPAELDNRVRLSPSCAARVAEGMSNFILSGRGGSGIVPDGPAVDDLIAGMGR